MDNLSAHKLKIIEPLIQSVGWIYSHFKNRWKTFSAPNASYSKKYLSQFFIKITISSYSPDFNPIELWWSLSKVCGVGLSQLQQK